MTKEKFPITLKSKGKGKFISGLGDYEQYIQLTQVNKNSYEITESNSPLCSDKENLKKLYKGTDEKEATNKFNKITKNNLIKRMFYKN